MSLYEQNLIKNTRIMNLMLYPIGGLQKPSGKYNVIHMYLAVGFNFRNTILSIYSMAQAFPDHMEEMVLYIIPLLVAGLATLKLLNFTINRNEFSSLMNIIKDNFWRANTESPPEEQEIILQYSQYVHLCCLLQSAMTLGAGVLWLFKPLIEMFIFSRLNSNQPVKNILPLNSWWPFNLDPYKSPLYEVEFILQGIASLSSTFGLAGTFCLFFHLVLNTCAQFKLIQMRLNRFDKTITGSEASTSEQEKALHGCIQLHQDVLLFCTKMETVLTMSLFTECFAITAFLCMNGFITTMFPGNFYIYGLCGICVVAALSEIFFHCLPPTMLTTEAYNVSYAAFHSNWYKAPIHVQKQIMFIIARAQVPVYLTAGNLTPMSVETFEAITRKSASFFTVLTSMKEA